MKVILKNVEIGKEVAPEWKLASDAELSANCLEILREIGCFGKELPINLQTHEQQLNFIADIASYPFGEVLNAASSLLGQNWTTPTQNKRKIWEILVFLTLMVIKTI